jgi:hypothetical protein
MAKQSGLGSSFFVGVYDISGDVGAITSAETTRGELDVTGIDKSAMERITTLRDGTLSFASFWNTTASTGNVAVLQAAPRTDLLCSAFIGSTLGYPAASILGKQINFPVTRAQDGSLAATTDVRANGYGMGLEWGEMLTTGKQSFATGTVNGTAIDLGSASTLFGAAAYLHVFSVASGTAVFAVQDSTDNVTFNNITGLVFTGATGATTQRLQTTAGATVLRYVRIQGTGTHGAAVVALNFVRYTESVVA